MNVASRYWLALDMGQCFERWKRFRLALRTPRMPARGDGADFVPRISEAPDLKRRTKAGSQPRLHSIFLDPKLPASGQAFMPIGFADGARSGQPAAIADVCAAGTLAGASVVTGGRPAESPRMPFGLFRLGVWHQRWAPGFLKVTLFAFGKKVGRVR